MKLNDAQFQAWAQYAEDFRSATSHNYVKKNPGRKALDEMRATLVEVTGSRHYPTNWGCTACVVDLFKAAGRIWLADAAERDAAIADKKPAEAPSEATDAAQTEEVKAEPAPAPEGATKTPAKKSTKSSAKK